MTSPVLEGVGIRAGYGDVEVLRGIDIALPPKSVVALIGANGAGKTTLLKTISGLLPLRGGEVRINEQPLDATQQSRLEELFLNELPALNPTAEPARSAELFSGEWECRYTTVKELIFAQEKGLLGLPWKRTYQTVDLEAGSLKNVIQFEEGALTVDSRIAPSDGDGAKFDFAFTSCAVRWRGFEAPLPPVGKGWGELLYLDETLRLQRDVRGVLFVHERVVNDGGQQQDDEWKGY